MARRAMIGMAALAVGLAAPAAAQRAGDNAVTAAGDAFGTSVGNETIGLYNPFEVRGFSAIDAGNARIDGLYFDEQIDPVTHLISGSTIRVGISGQGYPLPAPTGIVDYALRRAGDTPIYSLLVSAGPFTTLNAEADLQLPLVAGRLSMVTGGTISRNDDQTGTTGGYANFAVAPRWTPNAATEVIAFSSRSWAWGQEAAPAIFVAGPYLPPRIKRERFFGQTWTDNRNTGTNYGLLARTALGRTTLRMGVFRSVFTQDTSYSDLFVNVLPDGNGDHLVIAGGGQAFGSTSGELRASRNFGSDARPQLIHLVVRARDQKRRYGGDAALDLGRARIGVYAPVAEPDFTVGPPTRDHVRQLTGAIAYEGKPLSWLEASAGVQKAAYRKTTVAPSGVRVRGRDDPWLYNAAAALHATKRLAFYGSYTQGLEEGGVAPPNAANKDAASPALRTRQIDAGFRYAITDDFRLVAGAFDVRKPYFNLDSANIYRRLGDYRQRGIEMSLTGAPAKGLYVVAGTLLLDPVVEGEEVDAGLIGRRPVGQTRRLTIVNLDYQLPDVKGVSVNATLTSVASRVASRDNKLSIPGRSVIDLGARYSFTVGDAPATLSARVNNVFSTFGWRTNSSEVFVPNQQRRVTVTLAADLQPKGAGRAG